MAGNDRDTTPCKTQLSVHQEKDHKNIPFSFASEAICSDADAASVGSAQITPLLVKRSWFSAGMAGVRMYLLLSAEPIIDSFVFVLPWSDQVHANTLLMSCPAKTAHNAPDPMLRGAVDWRSRLITVSGNTTHQRETSVDVCALGVPSEIVQSQFGGVDAANKVGLQDLQGWLNWFAIGFTI